MKTLPTAEEFFDKRSKELGFENWTNVIVQQEWSILEQLPLEFAKLHVEATLEEALKESLWVSRIEGVSYEDIADSILKSYPLTNIK